MARDRDVAQRNTPGTVASRRQHPADAFRQQFDTLFDNFFRPWFGGGGGDLSEVRVWDFDVTEGDGEVTVRAELPGFDEKEIDVRLDNDVLTIQAEKEQKGEGSREYRSFFRQVTLPSGVDAEKAEASYRNGVLELHVPRPEGRRPKRITVRGKAEESGTQAKPGSSESAGQLQSVSKKNAAPAASKT
jgi:HSP20 family protein